jgi:NADH dehydrogenase
VAELARSALSRDFRAIDPRDAKVVLVEGGPRVLASFPEDLSQSAVEQLAELGAEVKVGDRVVAIDERGVELEARGDQDLPGLGTERERISAATVLWAAGVTPSALAARLGAPLDRQGRVVVNEDCSVPGRANVFAIGDMARFEQDGAPLPGVSPVAIGQARYVAREIAAGGDRGEHVARPAFRYVDKGSMATIGRSRAIAWARGIKLHGFMAWTAWLVVHIWYLIGFRSRLVVLLTWVWSYPSYGRGARLITSTGWAAAARGGGRTAPSPPAGPRAHEPGPLTLRAASRPS